MTPPFNHSPGDSATTPCTVCLAMIDAFMVRLRVELYTAAQVLRGQQLRELDEMLGEVREVIAPTRLL